MIIVFGSLNVDMVMPVMSMPRPGDTVLCSEYKLFPGGKGANQAVAAARAGSTVKMFGTVGQDDFGRLLCTSLEEAGVDIQGVKECAEHPTGCAAICVDETGENMITVASGANLSARAQDIPEELLTQKTTVILQMEVSEEENWAIIRRAQERGCRLILNLAPAQPVSDEILRALSVLVVNQIEITVLAVHLGFDVVSPAIAARRIASTYGITCVVTLGEEGAIACSPDETWEIEAMTIDAIDTTAAGDSFVGVLAASLDQDYPLEIALHRATVASGLSCLIIGAQPSLPPTAAIDAALAQVDFPRKIA